MRHAASSETPIGRELEARHISVEAKDGQTYLLRPIALADVESLIRGYSAMSPEAKWFRLLNSMPQLSVEAARRFCSPDPRRELCIVIEGRGALEGEILGGARIAGEPDDKHAEFSVSLRPEGQGLGLARKALEMALEEAREMGYEVVWGLIAFNNADMLHLAKRIGFHISLDPDDVSLRRAEISLA